MDRQALDRQALAMRARELSAGLAGRGVRAVALTWVDNAGVTRVKTVPVDRLPEAAAWGVGMSPVFDVFCVDDSITTSRHIGGPVGDLRLHPDGARLSGPRRPGSSCGWRTRSNGSSASPASTRCPPAPAPPTG